MDRLRKNKCDRAHWLKGGVGELCLMTFRLASRSISCAFSSIVAEENCDEES